MAEIRKLKQKRAIIKGQVTRINNTIKEDILIAEAKVKSVKIENLWEAFQQVQAAIEDAKLQETEDEDGINTEQEAEREIFEGIYFEIAAKIQIVMDKAQAEQSVYIRKYYKM